MSYQSDPYSEQEPTEEDYCVMAGHPRLLDDSTGWCTCRCGYVTVPPYDEPHDEYSAYRAGFKDEYLALATKNTYNPEDTIVTVGRKLEKEPVEVIQRLIEITKYSNPKHVDPTTDFDELLAFGVHLDSVGKLAITSVVADMSKYDDNIGEFSVGQREHTRLSTPEQFHFVRTAARLSSLLMHPESGLSWDWELNARKFVTSIYRELSEQPEKIPAVASLFNSRPSSPQATQLALALLRGDIEPVAPTLSEGLL